MDWRQIGPARGSGNRKGRRIIVGCVAGMTLVLAAGIAGAAPGNGKGNGHRDPISHAPVTFGASRGGSPFKAGHKQHPVTNLGSLVRPKLAAAGGRGSSTLGPTVFLRRSRLVIAGRPVTRAHGGKTAGAGPPAPTITASPTNPTYERSASFSFTDSDSTATFQCRLDGAKFAACTSPQNLAGPLSIGSHTYRVRAVNASGTSPVTSFSWTVSRPPAPTVDAGPGNPSYTASASFSFSDTLAGATFQCRLDGAAFATCTSPQSYSGPLKTGKHTFGVEALYEGATSAVTSYSWTISGPPAPTLTAYPANPSQDPTASFSFTDSLAGVTFQCRLDGASFSSCTSPQSYAGPLGYGTHTFRVEAVSSTGTSPVTSYSWSVVPPTPTITANPSDPTADTSATFAFTDSASGVTFECSLDGAAYSTCASPVSYGGLTLAAHTFGVRARSSNGTTSASATYTWTIGVGPATPSITSQPASSTGDTNATFSFSDSDQTATFQCSLDGAAFTTCTSPASYSALALGSHTFSVVGVDTGGTSPAASYSWTVVVPPAPTISSGPPSSSTSASATFVFDDASTGVTFLCSIDSSAPAACSSPTSYGSLGAGGHTFQVVAVSGTGTQSQPTTYSWSVEVAPPTITSSPSSTSSDSSPSFEFTDADASATFLCGLDGATLTACTSPDGLSGLTVGSHTFQVEATDGGMTSTPTAYTWTVVPPAPTISSSPTNPSSDNGPSFSFADGDVNATFLCSLDGAAFAACVSPMSYSGLVLGSHTFQVEATDGGFTSTPTTFTWTITAPAVKMRLLVISADGSDGGSYDFASNPNCSPSPCKGAIQTYLDEIGVPYDTLVVTQTPNFSASALASLLSSDGQTGNYYGIILTTGNLGYVDSSGAYVSAFTADEWQTLWDYEAKFHVRQVTSYNSTVGPPDNYGLNYVGETGGEVDTTLTQAGQQIFSYLNPSATIPLVNTYTYLAQPIAGAAVTPLVTDSSGDAIVSTVSYADGRQNLTVTTANAPWELHTRLLSYGIVNWLTRGIFLGERHVSLDVEVDDLLIDSDMWDPTTHTDAECSSGASPCSSVPPYRLTGGEFDGVVNWQNATRASNPLLGQTRLEFPFNGSGAYGDPSNQDSTGTVDFSQLPSPQDPYGGVNDTLAPEVAKQQANFCFINHTYDHDNLDLSSLAASTWQIQTNQQAAAALGLGCYSNQKFVQPDISGIGCSPNSGSTTTPNLSFLQAAYNLGVRFLISDTSIAACNNPSPNAGFYIDVNTGAESSSPPGDPYLLIIPRHPSNLFYNLQNPSQWVDEYNWYYCTCSPSNSQWKFWSTNQTYDQIIDHESDNLLGYLLTWDIDPLMFHQANLGLYDGTHSLLSDLLDATFKKYLSYYRLPIDNLTQDQVGQQMAERMAYNASKASGTLVPCESVTLSVQNSASVPITGVTAGSTETYGGQPISTVPVTAGSPVTIPISCG